VVARLRFCAVLGWALHLLVVSLAEKSRGLFLVPVPTNYLVPNYLLHNIPLTSDRHCRLQYLTVSAADPRRKLDGRSELKVTMVLGRIIPKHFLEYSALTGDSANSTLGFRSLTNS
jgi:hypothetical protein